MPCHCVFKEPEDTKCLISLHDRYVIVPTDKAPNNFVFVCTGYYYQCNSSVKLGLTNTYWAILNNSKSVISSFGINIGEHNQDVLDS